MTQLITSIKNFITLIKQSSHSNTYEPIYRLLEVFKDEQEEYTVHVQVINKSATFYIKPEEILANDKLVDCFSPRDVRTLTYLGYLGINSPKYTILAQRLADDNKLVFALKKKGTKDILVKTAAEILQEQEIIAGLAAKDAKVVGYAAATSATHQELS